MLGEKRKGNRLDGPQVRRFLELNPNDRALGEPKPKYLRIKVFSKKLRPPDVLVVPRVIASFMMSFFRVWLHYAFTLSFSPFRTRACRGIKASFIMFTAKTISCSLFLYHVQCSLFDEGSGNDRLSIERALAALSPLSITLFLRA